MGQGYSTQESAKSCQYIKTQFNDLLDVIRDAHSVTQHYARAVLLDKMPTKLESYRNYSDKAEEYFLRGFPENQDKEFRKNPKEELGMSYYQYYFYLTGLQTKYEAPQMTEPDRRKLIDEIFTKCEALHRALIEDLYETCDSQGRVPPPPVEAETGASE